MTAPTAVPSPEAFLAEPSTDEDDFEETTPTISGGSFSGMTVPGTITIGAGGVTVRSHADPLESIAASLQTLVQISESRDADIHGEEIRLLGEAYDDLQAQHHSLFELLADVEKIVAKSTSKVSLEVKAAIDAWRNPEIEDVPPADDPGTIVPPAVQCGACALFFADQQLLDAHQCTAAQGLAQPAVDAGVEAWRAYARDRGVEGAESMNRSQIRTALGLSHFDLGGASS